MPTRPCAWVSTELIRLAAGEQLCIRCLRWGPSCGCGAERYPWIAGPEQRSTARAERTMALLRCQRGEPCCDLCQPHAADGLEGGY